MSSSSSSNTNNDDSSNRQNINIEDVQHRCAMTTNALLDSSIAQSNLAQSSNGSNILGVIGVSQQYINAHSTTNTTIEHKNDDDTVSVSSSGGSTDGGDVADGWNPEMETYDETELDNEVRYMDTVNDVDTLDPLDTRHHDQTIISEFEAPAAMCTRNRLRPRTVNYRVLSDSSSDEDEMEVQQVRSRRRRRLVSFGGQSRNQRLIERDAINDPDYCPDSHSSDSSSAASDDEIENEHAELSSNATDDNEV